MKLSYVFVKQEYYLEDFEDWVDDWDKVFVVATDNVERAKEIVSKGLADVDNLHERLTISAELREIKADEIILKREFYYE